MCKLIERVKKCIQCHEKIFFAITLFLFLVGFVLAVILDKVYYEKIDWGWATDLFTFIKSKKPAGVSYQKALEILKGSLGMLMTIITVFLNTNISIKARTEQKVYGIYRNELKDSKNSCAFICMEVWNYLAPILMLVFINFSYCLSGYLLFFYSYLFLVLRHYIYISSFDRDKDRDALIKKLLKCLDEGELVEDKLWEYQSILENVGKNFWNEGIIIEAEILFFRLIEEIRNKNDLKNMWQVLFFIKKYFCINQEILIQQYEHLKSI